MIRGFTIAMIWGVVVGTYSTIYIATPILLLLDLRAIGAKADAANRERAEGEPSPAGPAGRRSKAGG